MTPQTTGLHGRGALEAGQTRELLYTLRAVTAGRFSLPEATAGAMYDPALQASAAGGQIEIQAPWTGDNL